MNEDEYEKIEFSVSNFIEGGKVKYPDGITAPIHDIDIHIEVDGELQRLLMVCTSAECIEACTMCGEEVTGKETVMVFDGFILYPCPKCNSFDFVKVDEKWKEELIWVLK